MQFGWIERVEGSLWQESGEVEGWYEVCMSGRTLRMEVKERCCPSSMQRALCEEWEEWKKGYGGDGSVVEYDKRIESGTWCLMVMLRWWLKGRLLLQCVGEGLSNRCVWAREMCVKVREHMCNRDGGDVVKIEDMCERGKRKRRVR